MRREDPGLLTGAARFASDIAPPGVLTLVFVRSEISGGTVRGLELDAARALPGVVAVLGAAELQALGARPMPCGLVTEGQRMTAIPALAQDVVQYAGQPLAAVLALDAYVAHDAAALVRAEIEALPPLLSVEAALAPGAPLIHPEWGTNVAAEIVIGGGDVDAALAACAVRIAATVRIQRQAPAPIEGRAAIASPPTPPDPQSGRITAWISTQSAHHAKTMIAATCGWPEDRLRVICPNVGGSFGLKEYAYPEEAVVCLLAAHTGRPVRWVEDRRENLATACHARESTIELTLGSDADGRVRALDGTWLWDLGGHPSAHGLGPARWGATMITGPYRVQATRMRVVGVATNKAPIGGYRGYGGPQAHLALERALDVLARALDLAPDEIRRRNLLTAAELPTAMPSGVPLDSGDYLSAYEQVLAAGRAAAAAITPATPGGRIGLGVAPYAMSSGVGPSEVAVAAGMEPSFESVRLAVDDAWRCVVHVPTSAQGQGHETLLADVAAQELGWSGDRVRVLAGDSDLTPYAPLSAVGSRTAVVVAEVVRRGARALGTRLDALPRRDWPGVAVQETLDPPGAPMTYGAHAAVIDVDPELGSVVVRRYIALDDCGPRLQPAIVEGQLRGGIAQGIGSALLEELQYGDDGRLRNADLQRYRLPVAATIPPTEFIVRETPAPGGSGGAKGIGEAGVYPPPAAIAQALDAALERPASAMTELPFTPERVIEMVMPA